MVVNSIIFLLFFVVVFIVYYLPLSKSKPFYQNAWLLLVSYFFYGYTDWRMITMLLGSTLLFYILGGRTLSTTQILNFQSHPLVLNELTKNE